MSRLFGISKIATLGQDHAQRNRRTRRRASCVAQRAQSPYTISIILKIEEGIDLCKGTQAHTGVAGWRTAKGASPRPPGAPRILPLLFPPRFNLNPAPDRERSV